MQSYQKMLSHVAYGLPVIALKRITFYGWINDNNKKKPLQKKELQKKELQKKDLKKKELQKKELQKKELQKKELQKKEIQKKEIQKKELQKKEIQKKKLIKKSFIKDEPKDDYLDEEPKRKKIKTEERQGEIPKLILLKDGDVFQSKLKFSNPDMLQNYQEPALLSDVVHTKVKFHKNQKKKSKEIICKKKTSTFITKPPVTKSSLVDKIKVRDVHTINSNFDSILKEINCFGREKLDVSKINTLTLVQLGTDEQTLQYFEQLYKKYFSKYIQDTILIINNIVFINYLTNMHCISRINSILSGKDKYVMAQNIQFQTLLHIKYIKILDNILKTNCSEVISVFEDSDYEQALLMFVLSLFINLKALGIDLFKCSNVMLKKLKQLDWTSVKKKEFDHNKIQTTLKSDIFCSTYSRLSNAIGEGSNTMDLDVIKFWKLFYPPTIVNASHFRFVIDAIFNESDVETVISLIEQASNKILLDSQLKNGHDSSNIIELQKLISMVNNSTQGICSNDTAQPSSTRLNTLNNIDQLKPIQAENTTPHIVHTNASRTLNPDENFFDKSLKNIPATLIPKYVQSSQLKNTSSAVFSLRCDLSSPTSTQSENVSTSHIIETTNLRTSVINKLNMAKNFPNTYFTNIPDNSEPNQVCQIENTSATVSTGLVGLHKSCNNSLPIQSHNINTPHIIQTKCIRNAEQNTTSIPNHEQIQIINPKNHANLRKKFDSTIKSDNILYRIDKKVMIKKPQMTFMKVDSNTSGITMRFKRL